MGSKRAISRMAWISDLAGMKRHGTRLQAACRDKACGHWHGLCVDQLIAELGEDADLRDHPLACASCGGAVLILASSGEGSPARPVR